MIVNDMREAAYLQAHWQEPRGDRRQEIVFIGMGIDLPRLRVRLDDSLLPEHGAPGPDALADQPDPFPIWRRQEEAA